MDAGTTDQWDAPTPQGSSSVTEFSEIAPCHGASQTTVCTGWENGSIPTTLRERTYSSSRIIRGVGVSIEDGMTGKEHVCSP